MRRGLCFSIVGLVVLGSLAGCGRSFVSFEEREVWRHEAEVQCLKSGAVKESAGLVRISPIEGPGICGADFPLKVAALGEASPLAFADDVRPPGAIPKVTGSSQPRWPVSKPQPTSSDYFSPAPITSEPMPQAYPAQRASDAYVPPPNSGNYLRAPDQRSAAAPAIAAGEPMSIKAPGIVDLIESDAMSKYPANHSVVNSYPPDRSSYGSRGAPATRPAYPSEMPAASAPLPTLGPARGPQYTGAIHPVEVKPNATLACPIVSALEQWLAGSVQPAAMRWFGQQVVEIKQISAYSCRGMNGQVGAKISEHAFGNALDIAAFMLADGHKIVVRTAWNGVPEEQGFLRDVQGGACQQFTTVLAPGSNRFHYDHIHVDLMRRASRRQICQPAAVSGEVVAARAAQKKGYALRPDPAPTGSIAKRKLADVPYEDDDHQYSNAGGAPAEQPAEKPVVAKPIKVERMRDW